MNSAEFGARHLDPQPLDLAAEQDLNQLLWATTQNVACTIGDGDPKNMMTRQLSRIA